MVDIESLVSLAPVSESSIADRTKSGTPLCITVDRQSPEDNQVTIRDRDTMEQQRVPIADIIGIVGGKIGSSAR